MDLHCDCDICSNIHPTVTHDSDCEWLLGIDGGECICGDNVIGPSGYVSVPVECIDEATDKKVALLVLESWYEFTLPDGATLEFFNIHPVRTEWLGNPSHPRYSKCDDECYICGRPVNTERPHGTIHLHDGGGGLAPVAADLDRNHPAEMGWWVVGPTCCKKLPAKYYIKWAK